MHTDGLQPKQGGFFDDDGNEINPNLIPKPFLCIGCKKNETTAMENILCTMNRLDQKESEEFICHQFEAIEDQTNP